MRRTNATNAHFLLGGIYGDTVYHHGAGSRPAWFYASSNPAEDERMRVLLRRAAFSDFDHLVSVLPDAQKTTFGPSTTNPPELTTRLGTVRPIPPPSRRPIPS